MTDQEHSDTYYLILNTIQKPTINIIAPVNQNAVPNIKKHVLHQFVTHHYLEHGLTEAEADDLHQYIEERNYA